MWKKRKEQRAAVRPIQGGRRFNAHVSLASTTRSQALFTPRNTPSNTTTVQTHIAQTYLVVILQADCTEKSVMS